MFVDGKAGADHRSYPNSGGAKKVQIYSPFVFMNKTGLPFNLMARTWNGSQKQVAGQAQFERTCLAEIVLMKDDHEKEQPTPFSKSDRGGKS